MIATGLSVPPAQPQAWEHLPTPFPSKPNVVMVCDIRKKSKQYMHTYDLPPGVPDFGKFSGSAAAVDSHTYEVLN